MSYHLNKISFGTSKKDLLCEIDIPYDVHDFCYIQNFGHLFVLKDNHCISRVDCNGDLTLEWAGSLDKKGSKEGSGRHALFNYPSSICYGAQTNSCYVIENGGASVRSVDIGDGYVYSVLGKAIIRQLETKMQKFDISTFKIASAVNNSGQLYWSIDKLNKCYGYNNGDVKTIVGNGVSRYSVANKIEESSVNNPLGIACIKEVVYVADTGNHCIREINKKAIRLVAGTLTDVTNLNHPKMLKYSKGLLYFIDDNCVKYASVSSGDTGTLYESDNIVSIGIDENKNLMVLEK